jgi:hypothetical protein
MSLQRLAILGNDYTDMFKNLRKDVAAPLQQGTFPHSKETFVCPHPPTLPTSQKDPCDI